MSARHPETSRLVHDCSRCGDTLNADGGPVENKPCYYVEADEERNPFTTDAAVALRHTDETRTLRDAYADAEDDVQMANDALARGVVEFVGGAPVDVPAAANVSSHTVTRTDPETGETVERQVEVVDVPDEAFDREVMVDPEVVKHDDEVVAVRGEQIEVDRPAMLLICADCKREGDRVEWAGDV